MKVVEFPISADNGENDRNREIGQNHSTTPCIIANSIGRDKVKYQKQMKACSVDAMNAFLLRPLRLQAITVVCIYEPCLHAQTKMLTSFPLRTFLYESIHCQPRRRNVTQAVLQKKRKLVMSVDTCMTSVSYIITTSLHKWRIRRTPSKKVATGFSTASPSELKFKLSSDEEIQLRTCISSDWVGHVGKIKNL